jgi:hypothetical protein
MDKWDYMKLKSFCTTKGMVSEKGLITRIYRKLKKVNSPKISKPIKK